VTLQEALTEVKRVDEVHSAEVASREADSASALTSALSSLFALAPARRQAGESAKHAEERAYREMLARRGIVGLMPATPEVIRELTATIERRVAELVEQARTRGDTCRAKEPPTQSAANKSPGIAANAGCSGVSQKNEPPY
jgi:hypothetical protein